MHVTEVRIWSEARPHTVASLVAPEDVDDQLAFAAGRPDVEAAIRRLSAMGWEVEAAEPA